MQQNILPFIDCEPIPTLYVIGNGFDVAHGIQSTYDDFYEFEVQKGNKEFVKLMEIFFSNEVDFWCDVETALGQYDEDAIIDFCNPETEFNMDHPTRSETAYVDSPDDIFHPLLDKLRNEFGKWVESIDIKYAEKIIALSKNAKYLTFNYTDTLETIYAIPERQVFHIHGKRGSEYEYIIGHSNFRNPDAVYDNNDILFMQQTREKVINWMNEMCKNSSTIISHFNDYFKGLSGIKQVIVLGHSLNDVDLPYFERIIAETGKDIPWMFSFYGNRDIENINKFIKQTGLTNTKLIFFDDFRIDKKVKN